MNLERKATERQRKAHKKSRHGCRNCKLRRVKCDEARPRCVKCIEYRVSCNYGDTKAPDLQIFLQEFAAPVIDMGEVLKPSLSPPLILMDSFQPSSFQLDRHMLDRLGRFQNGTVLSLGNAEIARLSQRQSIELACRAPYLMHIIQTLTIIHDHYLSGNIPSKSLFADICYHWSHGVSLFSRKLSSPIQDEDRDPLWCTAALCGMIACAAVEATGPEDAWPLKPSDDSDLDWLRMNEGKGTIFKLTKPIRENSVFRSYLDTYCVEKMQDHICTVKRAGSGAGALLIGPGIEQLPWQFIRLYDLDIPDGRNPYYDALRTLGELLPIECNETNAVLFLGFLNHLDTGFKRLLQKKDHLALLVLAFWQAKVCNSPMWWMHRRATVECQSTCLYLERYTIDPMIHELLEFPRARCGLGSLSTDS